MTFTQLVVSVGQIDVGKVSPRLCEYFGVVGCVLTPLGELQSAAQCVIPLPLITSGGKWIGVMENTLKSFLTALAPLLTNKIVVKFDTT